MDYWDLVMFLLLLHAIPWVSGQTTDIPNPCVSYNTLHADNGRSPNQTVTDNPICDRRINSGWYRLGPDGLHNQCVSPGKCGTVYPIWLKDKLPEQSEGIVEKTACISTEDSCCEFQHSVRVKMCQDFPVFYLTQTSGCDQAYCYVSDPDPCTTYQTLHSPDDRSPAAELGSHDPICDRRINEGWYRLGQSGLHTSCVTPGHCGTVYPIWMNGELPSANDGIVERTACISSSEDKCCEFKISVKVKMCPEFPVFFLTKTPGCDMAYCYGSTATSTTKKYSKTSRTPETTKQTPTQNTRVSNKHPSGRPDLPTPSRRPTRPAFPTHSLRPTRPDVPTPDYHLPLTMRHQTTTALVVCVTVVFLFTVLLLFIYFLKSRNNVKVVPPPNYEDVYYPSKKGKSVPDYCKFGGGPVTISNAPEPEKKMEAPPSYSSIDVRIKEPEYCSIDDVGIAVKNSNSTGSQAMETENNTAKQT